MLHVPLVAQEQHRPLRAKTLPLSDPASAATKLNDGAIRAALRTSLRACLDEGELIVEELGLSEHEVRADLGVLGAAFRGFEIKGETDSLARLSSQIGVYRRIFDTITVVAATKFVSRLRTATPKWCGIVAAERAPAGVAFTTIREASPHPHVDPAFLVQLLWRDEALELLRQHGPIDRFRKQPRVHLWQALVERLTSAELRTHILRAFSQRNGWHPATPRS